MKVVPLRRHELIVAAVCKHVVPEVSTVTFFNGEQSEVRRTDRELPFCPDCWAGMAIACPGCGGVITVGEGVALVKAVELPQGPSSKWVQVDRGHEPEWVCCLGMGCYGDMSNLRTRWSLDPHTNRPCVTELVSYLPIRTV